MRKLNRIVSPALIAAIALGAASPAFARPTPYRADQIRNEIAKLERDVNRNDNRDHISEREASGLRNDVRSLKNQFRDFNRNGLSDWEYRRLNERIENIRHRLHREHDRDHHRR